LANKIEIVRGTTNRFSITVTDANDALYNLASDEKLVFGIKRKRSDIDCVVVKTVSTGSNGVYTIDLTPEDTEMLEYGTHFYDVSLLSGDNFFNVIEPSTFEIVANVTKRGDGV
jgi:hypothetical protein